MRRIAGVGILSTALALTVAGVVLHGGDMRKDNFATYGNPPPWQVISTASLPLCVSEDGSGQGQALPCYWGAQSGNGRGARYVLTVAADNLIDPWDAARYAAMRDLVSDYAAGRPITASAAGFTEATRAATREVQVRGAAHDPRITAGQVSALAEMDRAGTALLDAMQAKRPAQDLRIWWDAYDGAWSNYLGAHPAS